MAFSSESTTKTDQLDTTIGTLKRCLQLAGTSNQPCGSQKEETEGGSSRLDGQKWPHCQHMLSRDDAKVNDNGHIKIVQFQDETQIADIMRLITKDLSEPYSIYTYRYFIHNWPQLCLMALDTRTNTFVGAVVCKLETYSSGLRRGYVAMLAVDEGYRRIGLGSCLVRRAIDKMIVIGCDEVSLETEVSNKNAQLLYASLGFIREKRLIRYYLNGGDAFRLKLYFSAPTPSPQYRWK